MAIDDYWYKNAVIYCLNVATYMDCNGDGIGDFEGLTRASTTCTRSASPACGCCRSSSPNRDNGYDVTDYYGVTPRFGTRATSSSASTTRKRSACASSSTWWPTTPRSITRGSSPRARIPSRLTATGTSGRTSARRDAKGMVFPAVQYTTWTLRQEGAAYYFHRFYEHQPDLNTANPPSARSSTRSWASGSSSASRASAWTRCPSSIERKGAKRRAGEGLRAAERDARFLQWRARDAILLAEANVPPDGPACSTSATRATGCR